MTSILFDTALALVIAAGLALAGELLLVRRPDRPAVWAESFLVGAGVAASLLFPLSLASPRGALTVLEILLVAAAALALALRIRNLRRTPPARRTEPARGAILREPVSLAALTLVIFCCAAFAVLNGRYVYLWDGFQIWAAKAQVLYYQGSLVPRFLPNDYFNRSFAYPSLVPMYEALLAGLKGRFVFESFKPIFLVFYLAMILATYRAARAASRRPVALAGVALLALLPAVSTGTAAGGYADLPEGACVAAVVAAFLDGDSAPGLRSPLPWLIGTLAAIKHEGAVLAVLCCLVAAASVLARRERLRPGAALRFVAPPAVLLSLRFAYVRWIGVRDPTFAPVNLRNLPEAVSRTTEVLRLSAARLFDTEQWGLFWIGFLAAAVYVFAAGAPSRVKVLAAGILLALAADTAVFLFTNWPVALHIGQGYPRLLQQIAPAAAIVLAAASEVFLRRRALPDRERVGAAAP